MSPFDPRRYAVAVALALTPCPALAGPIVNQPVDTVTVGGLVSNLLGPLQHADDFELTADAEFNRIIWWGYYGDASPRDDSFTIRVFAEAAPDTPSTIPEEDFEITAVRQPESQLVAMLRLSPSEIVPRQVFRYTADFSPTLQLPAGRYFLSIVNNVQDDTPSGQDDAWLWSTHNRTGNRWERPADDGAWSEAPESLPDPGGGPDIDLRADLAFVLVPEPSTVAVVAAIVLHGLLGRRRWGTSVATRPA